MRPAKITSISGRGYFFSLMLAALVLTGAAPEPGHAEHALLQKGEIKSFEPESGEIYLVDLVDRQVSVFSEAIGEKLAKMRDVMWFDGSRRVGFVSQEGMYAIETDIWEETILAKGTIDSFLFSSDADIIYYMQDGRFVAVNAAGKKLYSTDFAGELLSCAPDGNTALLQTDGGSVYLFDLRDKSFDKIVDLNVDTVSVEWTAGSLFLYDYTSMWVVDLATKRLTYFNDLKNAAFSPDKRLVVFRKSAGQAVYLLDLITRKEKLLLPEGGYIHSSWSRTGESIVLVTLDGRIRLVDKEGERQKLLVDVPYDWQWAGMVLPFWSGREDKFYYAQSDGVWEVDISGKRNTSEVVTFPFWVAPNWGSTVEYGRGKVAVVDLATGKRVVIFATQEVGRWWSKWSPDGSMLLLYDFPPLPQWQ